MRLRIVIPLVFTLLLLPAHAEEPSEASSPASTPKQDTTLEPELFFDEVFDDYQQELEVARENEKQGILIMFEMENCPFCARMKATVLNHSNVQDYYHKNFRIMTVDIDGDLEITDFKGKITTQKDFALKNRVRATPVFQFYDLEGEPLKNGRLTGATKDMDEFLLLGQYITEKKNDDMSFSRFKRSVK